MAVGLMIAAAGAQRQMNRPSCAKMLGVGRPVDLARSGTVATAKRVQPPGFLSKCCKQRV